MTKPGAPPSRSSRTPRRILSALPFLSLLSAPLGVALAHERLRPTLDEAARTSASLVEALAKGPGGEHLLTLNGVRFALSRERSPHGPLHAAEEVARGCGAHGLGAAFGTDEGAVGACVTIDSSLTPRARVTFARPRKKGAALLQVDSLDPLSLLAFRPLAPDSADHLPGTPRPRGQLLLGAALDGVPLVALYDAPPGQLGELRARLLERGAMTKRRGEEALYAELDGAAFLFVETTTGGETRLVALRLPN